MHHPLPKLPAVCFEIQRPGKWAVIAEASLTCCGCCCHQCRQCPPRCPHTLANPQRDGIWRPRHLLRSQAVPQPSCQCCLHLRNMPNCQLPRQRAHPQRNLHCVCGGSCGRQACASVQHAPADDARPRCPNTDQCNGHQQHHRRRDCSPTAGCELHPGAGHAPLAQTASRGLPVLARMCCHSSWGLPLTVSAIFICPRCSLQYVFTAKPLSGGQTLTITKSTQDKTSKGLTSATQVRRPRASTTIVAACLSACLRACLTQH